jgi:UDP-N-acetylmuramyl pentapeptide phosphotransferase/UDP-N-acetylglucosamine-1-phosphate transferase
MAMSASTTLIFCAVIFAVTLGLTGAARKILARRAILDHPNERSSHEIPTPRGGGWGVVPVVVAGWLIAAHWLGSDPNPAWALGGLALALGGLCWIDDLRGLSPAIRLLGQAAAVGLALVVVPAQGPYFNGLIPGHWDIAAAVLLWLWYINLFNFMDGIDGIAAVETAGTGVGIAIAAALAGISGSLSLFALILAAAAAGFLRWNWHPAKIFLGDVGSVPLGFLLGWLLLSLASSGQWAAALIIPAYYLADATLTLIRRTLRGEKIWRPHREHFYQQAIKKGAGHARVSGAVLAIKAVLVALAALAVIGWAAPALAATAVVIAGFLVFLRGGAGVAGGKTP